jgi:hypothetical protein
MVERSRWSWEAAIAESSHCSWGGYVGLEFDQVMRRFGRSVTIGRGKQLAEGKRRHCIRSTNDLGQAN